MNDINAQIKTAKEILKREADRVYSNKEKAVAKCCAKVEGTAKRLMTDTNTAKEYMNPVTYRMVKYKKPRSLPLYAPAVDTGALRRSITFDVNTHFNVVIGRVGSTILNPPYGKYLEFGTSKMSPRPWLQPALDINEAFIITTLRSIGSETDVQLESAGGE
jgi:HK97 gp10 family phage protein